MIGANDLRDLISKGESLEREFKSDRRTLADKEIYEEIVAMANTIGGILLIGVEDNGRVTGAKPRNERDFERVQKYMSALIYAHN